MVVVLIEVYVVEIKGGGGGGGGGRDESKETKVRAEVVVRMEW